MKYPQDSPLDPPMALGTVLGRKYRLDSVLGVGGMGTVYAATHRNRAELALKVLHPHLALDPDLRARFLLEAYSVNSVKHRGVVKIVDDDVTEDGAPFLVMERLQGFTAEELRERHPGGRLAPHIGVAIAEQVLDVLAAAHAAGVVHRDVKPSNMFVTTDGDIKLLDFGIARAREASPPSSRSSSPVGSGGSSIVGTPTYMAPEQAFAETEEIDHRTDLWAVGAALFTLLSGEAVHESESIADVLVKASRERARSLASVAPKTPRTIVEVVDCALAFEKSRRWASAAHMRAGLLAAYRIHFGRAPSRASLAALVRRVDAEQTSDDTLPAARVSTITRAAARVRESSAPSSRPEDARSRTSIPLASDVAMPFPSPPSRVRPSALVGALAVVGALAGGAQWWARTIRVSEPALTKSVSAAPPRDSVEGGRSDGTVSTVSTPER